MQAHITQNNPDGFAAVLRADSGTISLHVAADGQFTVDMAGTGAGDELDFWEMVVGNCSRGHRHARFATHPEYNEPKQTVVLPTYMQ